MLPTKNEPEANRPIVRYDGGRRSVTIRYQLQTHVVPGRYPTHDDAMIAGYAFIRAQGWSTST